MKIQNDGERNPNDLSTLVKRRLEKKAAGITYQADLVMNKPVHNKSIETQKEHEHEKPLVDAFNSLMLGFQSEFEPPSPQDDANRGAGKFPTTQRYPELNGTSNPFSALNKQEVSEIKAVTSERKVEFMVDLHDLGKVKVLGQFNGSGLQVQLVLPSVLPKSKHESLAKILSTQLAKAVGVPVEIQID
ncbi:hypothetical protein [Limnobacter parvus]|uniref:Flagellar hook-length control protein-like C-terminal domain-containing protein n=1 Tax=Limnobacter parvus TaxID=2939690 RepID=A0ABT1XIY4_9BURK|nr:hypothetical protein [Limnobacter parvus]MCR2747237.1 hypothetical protein [Limnobacter parvus]